MQFKAVFQLMKEKDGLGFLPNAFRPSQKGFRVATMQSVRVKIVSLAGQLRSMSRCLTSHDIKAMLAQGFHHFTTTGTKVKNRTFRRVQS